MESVSLTTDTQRQWCAQNDARAREALRMLGVDYRRNVMRPRFPFSETSLSFVVGRKVPPPPPPPAPRRPTLGSIKQLVAERMGVSVLDLESQRRDKPTAEARQLVMYLARKHTHLSLPQIAYRLGRKDHSTVLHGVRKIQRERKRFGEVIAEVEAKLG